MTPHNGRKMRWTKTKFSVNDAERWEFEQYNAQSPSDALAHDQFKANCGHLALGHMSPECTRVVALNVFSRRRQHAAMRVRHRKRRDQTRRSAAYRAFFATRCDRFVINNDSATLRFEQLDRESSSFLFSVVRCVMPRCSFERYTETATKV